MKSDWKVCIVTDKWCDANPNVGLSNNYNNIIMSLSRALPSLDISLLHYDELMLKHGKHIDTVLPLVTADIFIFCFLGNSNLNPSPSTISRLSGKKIFIWPDTVWPWISNTIEGIDPYADLHVAFDGLPDRSLIPSEALSKFVGKDIQGITPQNPDLYYPDEKIYDICFLGSRHSNRAVYVSTLRNLTDYKVVVGGGQREGKLSAEEYARIVRQSKFCLNLPLSPTGKRQLKGRAIESIASKTCLIEELPSPIENILNKDSYFGINSPEDISKILTEATDKTTTDKIENAYQVYTNKYSPKVYWTTLLSYLN
jgi:hypothetical protein